MSSTSEPRAFISYVREDTDFVHELENVLAEAGIPVWRDVNNLFPGDAWKAKIREAIQGDALAFLPVFSQRSESREKSQMREEIRLAIDECRKMAPDRFVDPFDTARRCSSPAVRDQHDPDPP